MSMYSIREQTARLIYLADTDVNYSASEFVTDLQRIADAGDDEIVTASKVAAVIDAAQYVVDNSRCILLNPFYDSFYMVRLDPASYGKYNTSVYFQLTGSSACDLMNFAYNTPAGCLHDFARAMEKQTAYMVDIAKSMVELFKGAYTKSEVEIMAARAVNCSDDFISKVVDVMEYIAPHVWMTHDEANIYTRAAVSRVHFPLV